MYGKYGIYSCEEGMETPFRKIALACESLHRWGVCKGLWVQILIFESTRVASIFKSILRIIHKYFKRYSSTIKGTLLSV